MRIYDGHIRNVRVRNNMCICDVRIHNPVNIMVIYRHFFNSISYCLLPIPFCLLYYHFPMPIPV